MTPNPTPRRKFRLTLRGMFVLITILGCVMGWVVMMVNNYRQEWRAVDYLIREHNAYTRTEPSSYSLKTSRPFLDGADIPWRIHRPVRHVTIEGKTLDEKSWKALAEVKYLETLALRDCTLQTTGDEFSRLGPLRSLFISNTSMSSHDIQAIGTYQALHSLHLKKIPDGAERYTPQLKELRNLMNLDFTDSPISASAFRDICQAQSVLGLNFDGTVIDWSEAHHLSQLENLKSLSLKRTNVTDEGLEYLAAIPNLNWLSISEVDISDEGVAKIANCKGLSDVRLSGTRITDESMEYLTRMPNLRCLDVSDNPLTDKGVATIANCQGLTDVRLSGTWITDEAMAHLTRLPDLQRLDVSDNQLTDEGVAKIASCEGLMNLRLSSTRITDESMEHFTRLPHLQWLDVSDNNLTNKALIPLAKIPSLNPYSLKIDETAITRDEINKFRAGSP